MIFRFIRSVFTRFAKTAGCVFFIAGLGVAGWFHQQRAPMIDSVRYRQSDLLAERFARLQSTYGDAQRTVTRFKAAADFPAEYTAAAFTPMFPQSHASVKGFQDLRAQLAQASAGRDAMKRFVTDRLESLLTEIQQKLVLHAAALAPSPAPVPQPAPNPPPVFTPDFGVYDTRIDTSEVNSRKSTLDDAKQFLGVLESSAENADNKKKLGDSISEIDALAKLLPSNIEPPSVPQFTAPAPQTREPLNAEKVAARLAQIRSTVRRALLSSWALDEALDRALQTAEEEQGKFVAAESQVGQLSGELHLLMAAAITAGTVLGLFFLLIGDWTQKSSTEIIYRSCDLIKDFSASPKEVYEIIEQHIAERKVPDLESSREFWHEGGALSAKREYLRLARKRLVFEICAAPFGTGFFFSFRCAEVPLVIDPLAIFMALAVTGATLLALASSFGLMWGGVILVFSLSVIVFLLRTAIAHGFSNLDRVLMKTPLIAPLYELFLRRDTYYRIDTMEMYLRAVQGATAEAVQSIFGDKAVNLLSETVPQPVMDELYRRRFS